MQTTKIGNKVRHPSHGVGVVVNYYPQSATVAVYFEKLIRNRLRYVTHNILHGVRKK